jgi:hypothetical protein
LITHAGTDAVVNVVVLEAPQPVAAPTAFLGAIYQLYRVFAVNPLAAYVNEVVLVTSVVGVPAPAARYTSYDVALAAAGQVSVTDVCVVNTVPAAGDVLITQDGTAVGTAVVNVVVLVAPQAVFAPPAFLGAIYQLYNVPAVRLLDVYVNAVVLVTSVVGVPVPAARYTSYDVAPAAAGQVSVTDVWLASVVPAAGDVLITQAGSATAVVNVVVLAAAQVVAAPTAFLGAIYQLYRVFAVNPLAAYVNEVVLVTSVVGVPVPAARYTSYDVAPAAAGQVSVAVFCVVSVAPATGKVLVTQDGTVANWFTVTATCE